MAKNNKQISAAEKSELLKILKNRFEKNMQRHRGLDWAKVLERLDSLSEEIREAKLWTLQAMEDTGGEPDVVGLDAKSGEIIFYDCAAESPKGRRSYCYDQRALDERKEHKPADSAVRVAETMGVEILDESQYRQLQTLGQFDAKTSSWLKTPDDIRKLGGAISGDFRFNHVWVYPNGAQSYYAARGFRASVRL